MGYFGANLGDHAEAASKNILAAPDAGPYMERAVHYNRLTEDSVAELDALSRQTLSDALRTINTRAAELQQRDADQHDATLRFRAGAFVYKTEGDS